MKNTLLLALLLYAFNANAQSVEPTYMIKDGKLVFNMSKDTILLDSLIAISKRYGVEKNFIWQVDSSKLKSKEPIRIAFGVSREQFETMAKRTAFNEKRVAILKQFYEVDFPNCGNGIDYLAKKREYLKKYPEYLTGEVGFREQDLNMDDEEANKIILNTDKYRQTHPN